MSLDCEDSMIPWSRDFMADVFIRYSVSFKTVINEHFIVFFVIQLQLVQYYTNSYKCLQIQKKVNLLMQLNRKLLCIKLIAEVSTIIYIFELLKITIY